MTDEETIKDAWRRAPHWPKDLQYLRVYPKAKAVVSLSHDDTPAYKSVDVVQFHREYRGPEMRIVGRYRDAHVIVSTN